MLNSLNFGFPHLSALRKDPSHQASINERNFNHERSMPDMRCAGQFNKYEEEGAIKDTPSTLIGLLLDRY